MFPHTRRDLQIPNIQVSELISISLIPYSSWYLPLPPCITAVPQCWLFHFSTYFCIVYVLLILWWSSNRGHNWSSAYGEACAWMSWPYFAVFSSRCSFWGRKTSDCELGGVLCWSHEQMCFLAGSLLRCVLLLPSALPSVHSDPC